MANKGASLLQGQVLNGDDYLLSPNGLYVALMQDDSNFVLYHATSTQPPNVDWSRPYWAIYWANELSNLVGKAQGGPYYAIMQSNGNFVLYSSGTSSNPEAPYLTPYWASHTVAGAGSYHLDLQSDGNLVLYNGSTALWASNTVAGQGVNMTILSGNNQTQSPLQDPMSGIPTATFGPLSVALKDNIGNPLSGQQVTWAVGSKPDPNMMVKLASTTTTTDSNGIATLSSVQVSYRDRGLTITASSGGASATFNLTVGGLTTSIVSGNNQSVPRASHQGYGIPVAFFAPLQLKVVLAATGQPWSGTSVDFYAENAPSGMVVDLSTMGGRGYPSAQVITDSNGIATFNSMVAYYASGSFTVVCTTLGGNTVTFNETVSS